MHLQKMVLDQDLRRITDINVYEAAFWPSFALKIFYAFSEKFYVQYFGNKKWRGQKILGPPTSKSRGNMSPPLNSVLAGDVVFS